eukprot:gene26857-biopygen17443
MLVDEMSFKECAVMVGAIKMVGQSNRMKATPFYHKIRSLGTQNASVRDLEEAM